ncbi:MAG TPA: carboxypeptidase regulatory-like domain-containing protein [Bryobacteraceae bacterium]|nr:carboxypeptidase regulatory-like domain-containing protein [Bryobacteraceae bacterium]
MKRILVCAIAAMLAATATYAQLTRGAIIGSVQDPSGAVIANATIRIVSNATKAERTTTSNNEGLYRFDGVDPGVYNVIFDATGFAESRVNSVSVSTSQEVTLNQRLAVGTTATTVDVTDNPAGVELAKSTATIQRTLPQAFLENVPTTSGTRDVNQLALLAPTAAHGPGSTGISINGQRARNNDFLLDGIDNNDSSVTLSNNRVTPETTGEFQVQTQAYSAEFGRNSGGQIQVITRSGTNAFHGEAYEYWQGNSLIPVTLPNKRNGLTYTPRFDQNQVGGSLGGPIRKNRLFFFANLETDRRAEAPSAGNATTATIPTAAGYQLLSTVPLGAGETAAARAAALKALSFLPSIYAQNPGFFNLRNVTVNGAAIPFGSVSIPLANPYVFWLGTARGDYVISDHDTAYVRSTVDDRNQPDVISNLQFGSLFSGAQVIRRQNHVLSETHVFSPTLTNQFSFAFIRSVLGFPENDPTDPSTGITGAFTIGGLSNFPQGRTTNEFQWLDTATWVRGRHSVKFGVNIVRQRLLNLAAFDTKGTYSFNNFADFLNNQAATLAIALNTASFDARQVQQSYFAQDDVKVTRNLTLNLGIRYEYANAPFGFFGATDPAIQATLVPGPAKSDKNNWAPRAGLAYSPSFKDGLLNKLFGEGVTVFRGGYGMAYDFLFYNILTVNGSNYPRVVSLSAQTADLVNQYPNLIRGNPAAFNPLATFVNSPTNLQAPTTHFYSASVQRQLGRQWIVEVGYTGSRAYHGVNQEQANPGVLTAAQAAAVVAAGSANVIPTLQSRRLFPQFGSRVLISSDAIGNYNAGYVKVDKRLSRGLLVGFNYTYSRNLSNNDESLGVAAITNGSPQIPQNFNDFRSEYGLSAFDRPHRYVVYFNYDLPWFKSGVLGGRVVRGALGGWTLNGFSEAQSGQPFTIFTGVDTYGVGSTAARPDYNPGGMVTLDPVSHDWRTFTTALNGTGIVVTPLAPSGLPLASSRVQFGNLGRNTFRGPGLDNQNLTLIKKFAITERVALQFRGEFFDLLNHRNFSNPVSNMSSPSFGQNTSDPGGRLILLSGRVIF